MRRRRPLCCLVAGLLPLLAACAGGRAAAQGEPPPVLADPAREVLVLFYPGSGEDLKPDACDASENQALGAYAIPGVLARLPAADPQRRIRVVTRCQRELRGDAGGPAAEAMRSEPCAAGAQIKVCKRAARIEADVAAVLAANPGLARDRLFLAGASAGAWASLLVLARNDPGFVNGMIGFAPAFAGKRPYRPDPWPTARERHITHLATRLEARPAHGLLFAFLRDPYEDPTQARPALPRIVAGSKTLLALTLPAQGDDPKLCNAPFWLNSHSCASRRLFTERYQQTILRWIDCRVADPTARCLPVR